MNVSIRCQWVVENTDKTPSSPPLARYDPSGENCKAVIAPRLARRTVSGSYLSVMGEVKGSRLVLDGNRTERIFANNNYRLGSIKYNNIRKTSRRQPRFLLFGALGPSWGISLVVCLLVVAWGCDWILELWAL
jgi:hypothetical protein